MGERKRGGRPSSARPFLPRSGSCGSWGGEGPRGQGETRAQLPGPGRRPPRSPWGGFGLRFAAAGTDLEAEPVPRGSRGRRGGHDEHPPAPSGRSGAAVRWPAELKNKNGDSWIRTEENSSERQVFCRR